MVQWRVFFVFVQGTSGGKFSLSNGVYSCEFVGPDHHDSRRKIPLFMTPVRWVLFDVVIVISKKFIQFERY